MSSFTPTVDYDIPWIIPKYRNSSVAARGFRISFGFAFPRFMIGLTNSHHFLNPESNRDSLACRHLPALSLVINPLQNSAFYSFQSTRLFPAFFILREFQEKSWVDIEFRGNKPTDSEDLRSDFLMAISCFISCGLQLKEPSGLPDHRL